MLRIEKDSLGEVEVPSDAYYGAQTQRARENFPISGTGPHTSLITATAYIKIAAARANMETGGLEREKGDAIVKAANRILAGEFRDQFVVDVFQAGAGTSYHMNVNEVIANVAIEMLGGQKGDYSIIHPNDHVNCSQSTNDVFPTSMRIAALLLLREFFPVLDALADSFFRKAEEFKDIIKSGRTHLQDAAPVRLGQELSGYYDAIRKSAQRMKKASESIEELGIGGSAVGTGLNTHPGYAGRAVEHLRALTGLNLRSAENLFEAMQSNAPLVELSGSLKELAVELTRIANDLRLLSSGPKTGLAEITLPPVQPGSSIMPGKVNPVMAEMLNMVCFAVMGNDLTITLAAQAGQLELNVMMPVICHKLLDSIEILINSLRVFAAKCIDGVRANRQRCEDYAMNSMAIVTALNPIIGYAKAAEVAKEALSTNKSLRHVILEKGLFTREKLDEVLSPAEMTHPR